MISKSIRDFIEGEYKKCIKNLEKMARLKPDDAGIRVTTGLVYYRIKEYERAILYLEEAKGLNSGLNPKVYYLLGKIYLELGMESEAKESFKDSIRAGPESEYAPLCKKNVARLESPKRQVERGKLWHLGFSSLFQYDDNVKLEPELEPSMTHSLRGVVKLNGRIKYPLYKLFDIGGRYSIYQSYHFTARDEAGGYDFTNKHFKADITYKPILLSRKVIFRIQGDYNLALLAGKGYFWGISCLPMVNFSLFPSHSVRLIYKHTKKDFGSLKGLSGTENLMGLDYIYISRVKRRVIHPGLTYSHRDTDAPQYRYKGYSGTISMETPFIYYSDLVVQANYQVRDFYKNPDREDRIQCYSVKLGKRIWKGVRCYVSYTHARSDSIKQYEYTRNIITFGLDGRF